MKKFRPTEPRSAVAWTTDEEKPATPKDGWWRCRRASSRGGGRVLFLSLATVFGVACQRLDPNLSGGGPLSGDGTGGATESKGGALGTGGSSMGGSSTGGSSPGGAGTGGTVAGASGTGGMVVAASECPMLRTQVYDILQTNCALCHQAPGNPDLYLGNFNFILDLVKLTSTISPQSTPSVTLKYVVKGSPNDSFIHRRILDNSMPPATRTQRPTPGDIQVLGHWITSCIDDPTSPRGWSGSAPAPDGGVDAGPMLESCGPANVCPSGSCCVFNQCRPNGTTCGGLPNPIPGQADLPGLPGMCTNGSCRNAAGNSCGKVGEPCCDFQSCTASQSSCLTTDMTMCSACGGTGQPCCKPTNCLAGRACVGSGVGRVGMCQLCGAVGQPCCGTGGAALQTCDGTLTCVTDALMGTRCASGDGGTTGAAGAPGAGGRGGSGAGGQRGGAVGGRGGNG